MLCNIFRGYEIYVIIIIDCKDVKWERFYSYHTIKDVLKYLKITYNIKSVCLSINEMKYCHTSDYLIDYIEDIDFNAISMKVATF